MILLNFWLFCFHPNENETATKSMRELVYLCKRTHDSIAVNECVKGKVNTSLHCINVTNINIYICRATRGFCIHITKWLIQAVLEVLRLHLCIFLRNNVNFSRWFNKKLNAIFYLIYTVTITYFSSKYLNDILYIYIPDLQLQRNKPAPAKI